MKRVLSGELMKWLDLKYWRWLINVHLRSSSSSSHLVSWHVKGIVVVQEVVLDPGVAGHAVGVEGVRGGADPVARYLGTRLVGRDVAGVVVVVVVVDSEGSGRGGGDGRDRRENRRLVRHVAVKRSCRREDGRLSCSVTVRRSLLELRSRGNGG